MRVKLVVFTSTENIKPAKNNAGIQVLNDFLKNAFCHLISKRV